MNNAIKKYSDGKKTYLQLIKTAKTEERRIFWAKRADWCDRKMLAQLRGDSIPSRWADDYFEANPAEYAARLAANLEPELNRELMSGREGRREESANIEKLLWGPTSVKLDSAGRVYIVDQFHRKVDVFRPASLATDKGYLGGEHQVAKK